MHDSTTRPTRINDPSCTTLNKPPPRQLLNKPPPRQLLNKSPPRQLLNKPPPHHLKRKATDSLFLLAIVITLDSIKVFAESVSDVFQIRLYRNIFTDRRAMESLKTREFLVKDAIEPVGRWSTFHDSSLVLEEVASLLAIRSSYIPTIRKKDNIIFKAFCMANDDNARSLRSPSKISIHPEEITDTTSSSSTINKSLTTRLSTPVQESARAATPATPLFDELPAPAHLSPLPSCTSTLQVIPPATPNYAPPSPLQDDHQTPVPASPLQSNTLQDLPPATPNYAPPSPLQDDLQTPVPASPLQSNTLQDLPPATPTPLAQDKLYTIATPTPAANMYKPTPSAKLLRFKARSMLVDGNMPLFPSAKRDWATVEEESILLFPNLVWPPKNWRRLTPDQRLLVVEFASMSLTQTENNSSLLLPEGSFLIHNFHFLVLPGSACFPLDNKAKARLYTYQSLLDIANGKDQSPFANQTDLLKALTPLFKKSSTLLEKISQIPVRM
ncbi:hypothetical protein DPMN_025404 [Dreissena polymorpha]|uniref:Uncharacterized protein n=1 Tax=Dreissena polymorpha TaxID=45954 RepID=A0A9D4LRG5_DREPO|nr:hypothetical protein DPMN_025404 [Dreissena polymorpha]